MNCACQCYVDTAGPSCGTVRIHKARKKHRCCECYRTINPGERYEYSTGCYDDCWFDHKTCLGCHRLRDAVCKRGYIYGELAQLVKDCYSVDIIDRESFGDTSM